MQLSAAAGDAGLDFDLGSDAGRAGGKSEDDILDITAAVDTSSDDLLDVTAAVGLVEDEAAESRTDAEEMFDITTGDEEGGMLDITASAEEGGILDITAGAEEEDMLDLTAGAEEAAGMELIVDRNEGKLIDLTVSEDILDVSKEKRSGVDLLDVTSSMTSSASSALELDSDEDLLDVTAATSAGADSDELLEIDFEREVNAASGVKDDNVIDFDVGALEMESDQAETIESDVNNVIEFDITASGAGEGGDDEGLELSLGAAGDDLGEEDGGIELDLSDISGESDDSGNEFSLSLDIEGDATVQADIDSMFDIAGPGEGNADDEIDMNMTMEMKKSSVGMSMDNGEMEGNEVPEIDLTLDDEGTGTGEDEIDIEGTVEIPKFDLDMDDDNEGDARTVFVPRSMQPEEQSDEEEITTKLDLAKAYIELGDKDSAKIILAEVMAEGNTDQRQQAQELLGQI